ncbi:vesicle-associated protein [Musa troglodytarum]|uniref:Vesicle-associated protein n=1 Tax=Musa troglodytarum TaxID=320322 RepID=A0A9E7JBB8_9LILI|nr:vesicle-associated protein [Musa troglodytarum]
MKQKSATSIMEGRPTVERISRFFCVCVSLSLSLPAVDEAKGVDRSIDPVMGSGDLLGVEPLELKFPFELNKQISCSVQLSNKTEDFLAFKVKTTNPRKYCVRPNVGIILPRSTCDVVGDSISGFASVTMQAQREAPPEMQCKDKFLLQSIATSSTTTLNDITQEMFSKEPGKIVDEVKIQVAYVSPPQPLSNVYEQSEEGGASPSPFGSDKASMISREYATASRQQQKEPEEKFQAMALISRLTEEKNSALQQNSKLRQEVELMRREIGKRRGGLSFMSLVLIALLAALVGYLMKK